MVSERPQLKIGLAPNVHVLFGVRARHLLEQLSGMRYFCIPLDEVPDTLATDDFTRSLSRRPIVSTDLKLAGVITPSGIRIENSSSMDNIRLVMSRDVSPTESKLS
jgi:hypothetical protein